MTTERLIQAAVVRADMAICAAWRVLKIALGVALACAAIVAGLRRLRRGR